eukprot:9217834-Pyramimonas_sp.AAC.2
MKRWAVPSQELSRSFMLAGATDVGVPAACSMILLPTLWRRSRSGRVKATYDEIVPCWTRWRPTGSDAPQSTLGALPFPDHLDARRFPAVSEGSAGGARRSWLSEEWRDFLSAGEGCENYVRWKDFQFFLERSYPVIPGMPPKGQTLRQFGQKI